MVYRRVWFETIPYDVSPQKHTQSRTVHCRPFFMFGVFPFFVFLQRKQCVMKNILTDIRQLASKVIPAGSSAWLYGSRARGSAHSHSDWDILLILDKDTLTQSDYDSISYPFVLLGCELGEEINPIMYTEKEWQLYKATPFYENVKRDAINLLS